MLKAQFTPLIVPRIIPSSSEKFAWNYLNKYKVPLVSTHTFEKLGVRQNPLIPILINLRNYSSILISGVKGKPTPLKSFKESVRKCDSNV